MTTTLRNRRGKKTKNAPSLRSDVHLLFNDKVRVYRTKHSGDVYQLQMYVASEGKYLRKSLRTRDKDTALAKAEIEYINVRHKVLNGEVIFSPTIEEFRNAYLQSVDEQVSGGQIRQGRANNIATYTKRFLEMFGAKTRLSDIKEKDFLRYRAFRQSQKHDITMTVVRNESITIKQMFKWGKSNGFVPYDFDPDFGKIRIAPDETKRQGMSDSEYKLLVDTARLWYKQGEELSEEEIHYRRLIRDFVVLLGNFGFRTQELRLLKFKDVYVREDGTAEVVIQPENTKVNKRRPQRGRRGDVFVRRKQYQKYSEDDDYVFGHFRRRDVVPKDLLYDHWNNLKQEVNRRNKSFDVSLDLYDIRHFFITAHLRANKLTIWEIAKLTGTSVTQIERHYNHVSNQFVSDKLLSYRLKFNDENMLVLPDDYEDT